MTDARLALRPQMECEARDRIRSADGGRKISFWNLQSSISDADKVLDEGDMVERREGRRRLQHMEERERPERKARVRDQER